MFLSVDPVTAFQQPLSGFHRYRYGNNNPYRFTDPDGRWGEDLFIGVPSIVLGLKSGYDNVRAGNYGSAVVDAVGVVVDAAAIATPGVPGGAGLAIKAGRALENAGDVATTARGADNVVDGANAAPDFVVSPGGTAFPVPNGATGPTPVINPAGKEMGAQFTGGTGGANGQVATMRIMDPNAQNPTGYVKYENAQPSPQGVDPYTGRTVPPDKAHHPID